MTGRRRNTLLLASALAALLAACSGTSTPPPATPTPATSAPTPSPTATPPQPPDATADQKGAEAFVRYFWAVFNYTYASGDTKLLRSMSTTDCGFCRDVAAKVDRLTAAGSRTTGGRVEVLDTLAPPGQVDQGLIVTCAVNQAAAQTLSRDGTVLSTSAPLSHKEAQVLVLYRGRWTVAGVQVAT